MSPCAVVLVGPMGSGKSSVGRALARRLDVDHADTDAAVEQTAGRSIAEIFETEGEEQFRRLESAALETALASSAVVSTGGGIVVTEANRTALQHAPALVVWLDGSVEALLKRVGSGRNRPLLTGDLRRSLEEKITERRPGYRSVADLRIDTSDMRRVDCVDAIVAAMEGVSA